VFAGLYPPDGESYEGLRDALDKLILHDRSVHRQEESHSLLGRGWRLGFLGSLHMQVFKERLEKEFNASSIFTQPTVAYKLVYKAHMRKKWKSVINQSDHIGIESESGNGNKIQRDGKIRDWQHTFGADASSVVEETRDGLVSVVLQNMQAFPDAQTMSEQVAYVMEPIILASILAPQEHIGPLLKLCQERRGIQQSIQYIDGGRVHLGVLMPLAEVIIDFHDILKATSSGYARYAANFLVFKSLVKNSSFDWEDRGWQESDIVQVTALLNGKPIPDLSLVSHRSKAVQTGRSLVSRLAKLIPRQQFDVVIQATLGAKILARDVIKQYRKDVTAKLYGGDVTRRMKLLERQKEGKKRLKAIGNIQVPPETFIGIVKGS
jgi:translation factor GUF1, mitochondrial